MVLLIIGTLVSSARLLALPDAEKRMTRLKTLIPRRSKRYPVSVWHKCATDCSDIPFAKGAALQRFFDSVDRSLSQTYTRAQPPAGFPGLEFSALSSG